MQIHRTRSPRAILPDWYKDMVQRMKSDQFQIVGLPPEFESIDHVFPDRAAAEETIAKHLPQLHARLKRGPRLCLCCDAEFISTGISNRLCDACRAERMADALPRRFAAFEDRALRAKGRVRPTSATAAR